MEKKICLLLAALLCAGMVSACEMRDKDGNKISGSDVSASDITPGEPFTPHRFSKSDLTVNGNISLGMTVAEVKEVLGQPDSEGTFRNDDFIYGAYTALTYGDLSLTFFDAGGGDNFLLGTIWSKSASDIFAGGLHVGSTADEVIAAFTRDEEAEPLYFAGLEESYGDYLYGNYTRDSFLEYKPKGALEYAYINKWGLDNGYETEYTLEYYCGDPLVWNEDETAFSGELYSIIFYVDSETDLVKNIMLSYDWVS